MSFPPRTADEQNKVFGQLNQIIGMMARGNLDLTKAEAGFIVDGTLATPASPDLDFYIRNFRFLGSRLRDHDDPDALDRRYARLVGLYDQWFGHNIAQIGSIDHMFELVIEHDIPDLTLVRAELYGLSQPSVKTSPPFPGHSDAYEFMGFIRGTDHTFPAAFGQQFQIYEDPNNQITPFSGSYLNQTNPDLYYWMDPPPALNPVLGSSAPVTGAAPGPYLTLDNQFTHVPPLAIWDGSPYYQAPRDPIVNEYRPVWGTLPTGKSHYYLAADRLARETIPAASKGIPRGYGLQTSRDLRDNHDWVVLVLHLRRDEVTTPVAVWAPAVEEVFELWTPPAS